MSGFFGLLQRRGPSPDTVLCQQLLEAQAYRGPDHSNAWCEAHAALGHSLLATTAELGREPQPFRQHHGGAVISADVRLDNRAELGTRLGLTKSALPQMGDAQLILEAWQRWGEECPQYLLGDFAFTLWDPQRQILFGARDHLGIKPFYYHLSNELCMTASDTLTLLAHPAISTALNEYRIADFFFDAMEAADLSSTFYNSLQRLPPAHSISVDMHRVRRLCYWQPQPDMSCSRMSQQDADDAFIAVLQQAVACRLPSSNAAGILLSGGVDSALVTGVAAGLNEAGTALSPTTYSAISGDRNCGETSAISTLQQQLNLPAKVLPLEQEQQVPDLSFAPFMASCEPFDMSMTLVRRLYSAAAQNNQRVLLDGVEGDLPHSLLTDYPASLLLQGSYLSAWREALGLQHNHFNGYNSLAKTLRQSLLPGLIPKPLRRGSLWTAVRPPR